jgi:putative nucleotidyltransferase with HDIG domain
MKDIETIINGIVHLKPIPRTISQIMDMASDPEVDIARLADTIAQDPVLTANLLKDANSAYYGSPRRFETVRQATVFLGMAEVFDLVLMEGCRDTLSPAQEGYDQKGGGLWRYSLFSALLAKAVAVKSKLADTQLVFTVGMLKDIGKLVLSQYVAQEYEDIRRLVDTQGHSFREAEKMVLGIDHAELGAMVARVWKFSPKMVRMIRCHHQPLKCTKMLHASAAVYMGDLLCMMLGTGGGADGLAYRFQCEVTDLLGLSETDIQSLLVDFQAQMERLNGLFG